MKRSLGLIALLLVAALAAPAAAQPASERAVKAAFLVKFGNYVTWPGPATAGPITLCIVGRDPLGSAIDRAAAGQQVNGRPLAVRRLPRLDHDSGCAIAYLLGSNAQAVPAALAGVAGTPVLTITDAREGTARGVIHFEIVRNRVRFHIDERAAAASGLSVSSKLLAIALTVRSRMSR